jgi:hypothetical protein
VSLVRGRRDERRAGNDDLRAHRGSPPPSRSSRSGRGGRGAPERRLAAGGIPAALGTAGVQLLSVHSHVASTLPDAIGSLPPSVSLARLADVRLLGVESTLMDICNCLVSLKKTAEDRRPRILGSLPNTLEAGRCRCPLQPLPLDARSLATGRYRLALDARTVPLDANILTLDARTLNFGSSAVLLDSNTLVFESKAFTLESRALISASKVRISRP